MEIMRIPISEFKAIKAAFDSPVKDTHEQLCFLGVRPARWSHGRLFMVREVELLGHDDYLHQSAGAVQPRKDFQDRVFHEMIEKGLEVFTLHTHLGQFPFSPIDRGSVFEVAKVLVDHIYGNVIFNQNFSYFSGRFYDPELKELVNIDRCEVVGGGMEVFLNDQCTSGREEDGNGEHHRQYLIPGLIRRRIESARVAVVGLGGNGASVLEHLACIGFGCGEGGKIYLVDHDTVESSNLARIPYASRDDVGKQKADVALEYLNWKAPDAVAEALTLSVTETEVIERLKSCNLIFGCTDSDYSRKALNELSISCLIPYIDLGCGIVPKEGSEYFSGGQVRVVMPGVGPCLACTNGLDPNRTARETFSEEEVGMRVSAGYVQGFESNPTASIFHLNTTIASQGISQAIKMILDEDLSKQFYLFYDQRKGRLKPMPAAMHHRCPICGPGGILGSGTGYIKTTYEKIENIPEEISVRD